MPIARSRQRPPVLATSWCLSLYLALISIIVSSEATSSSGTPHGRSSISLRLPGKYYDSNGDDDFFFDDEDVTSRGWATTGRGREFDLFDTRGGTSPSNDQTPQDSEIESSSTAPWTSSYSSSSSSNNNKAAKASTLRRQRPFSSAFANNNNYHPFSKSRAARGGATASSSGPGVYASYSSSNAARPTVFQTVQDWWTSNISPNIKNLPRINCRVEPTTTLKIRKTFRPLKTIVRFGADFNTQLGVWQFKSSWEDAIIGGKITLAGKELQLSKSWQLSVGELLLFILLTLLYCMIVLYCIVL